MNGGLPPRLRVLVADSDAGFCAAAEAVLRDHDRVEIVGCAHDGNRALELTESLQPDLVLLGIKLPLINGLGVADRIRRLRPSTAVVVVTGADDEGLADRARVAGAAAFLRKDARLFENLDLTLALVDVARPD